MECNCSPQSAESMWALIISIVAILVSVIAIIVDKHINRSSLRVEFYADHFHDALNKKIPAAIKHLSFENERIKDYEQLQDELATIRKEADYFKYADPHFYHRFKRADQEIEDFIAEGLNKQYDDERAKQYLKECENKIRKLYKIVTRNYFG